MSTGTQKRTRQQRVASVELPPGVWGTLVSNLRRGHVLLRLALCLLTALLLWGFTRGWDPPFGYQVGQIPLRNVIARIDFEQPDLEATDDARIRARKFAFAVYDQDPEPLIQLRAQLRSEIGKLLAAETFERGRHGIMGGVSSPAGCRHTGPHRARSAGGSSNDSVKRLPRKMRSTNSILKSTRSWFLWSSGGCWSLCQTNTMQTSRKYLSVPGKAKDLELPPNGMWLMCGSKMSLPACSSR